MRLEYLLTIAFICIIFSPFCSANGQNTSESCLIPSTYTSRSLSGICKPLLECPSAIGLLHVGIMPTLCPTKDGRRGIICCPNEKRISSKKCDEFTNVLKEPIRVKGALMYDGGYSQKTGDDNVLKCESFFTTFIVGGRDAREREYPYQAAVGYGDKPDWRCSGTLIDAQWVVSAGHCGHTVFGPPTKVLLGDRKLSAKRDPTRVIVNVSEVLLHPKFKPPLEYNDIVLLKLESPVQLSRGILPACLPDPEDRLDRALGVEATGWGQTSSFSGQVSDILQTVTLAKFNTSECSQFFESVEGSKRRLPKGIIPSQFCAGDKHGVRDTCKGDSGGPVTVTKGDVNCVHYIVGITSFGSSLCGFQQPGVYSNVLSYLDWIEDIVWYNFSTSTHPKLYVKVGTSQDALLVMNPSVPNNETNYNKEEVSSTTTPIPQTTTEIKLETITGSTTSSQPPPLNLASSTAATTQTSLTSNLQNVLSEATTNVPSITEISDGYLSRISSSISTLLSNISIG